VAALSMSGMALAQSVVNVKDQQIAGPTDPAQFPSWLKAMKEWRTQKLAAIGYDPKNYDRVEFAWTRTSFIQPQMMVEDRFFYDVASGRNTVSKYLEDAKKRYGGIDSILIWPTYPNIGVDDRNTDDMIRSLPGGIPGVRQMVKDFQKAGVRVLFPIHPWDVGTRDPVKPWGAVLPETMKEIGADGLNGDTMYAVTPDYLENADAIGHPLVLEPEIGLQGKIEELGWNLMSWGYWNTDDSIPMVSTNKWLEPRHMVHICDRWATNKTNIIQDAFFNGVGIETWENVWGIWNGLTDRDCEAIRRVSAIEHQFSGFLSSADWEPHTPTLQKGVYASKWPGQNGGTLWTMINRGDVDLSGAQISVPYQPGLHFDDLWHGSEIQPEISGNHALLSFPIESRGYGAVLATRGNAPKMLGLSSKPLKDFSQANVILKQTLTPIPATVPVAETPEGMVKIPGANFDFEVNGIEIEGEDMVGLDVQYPWESEPRRAHKHIIDIKSFYIDKYPVTNAQFKQFLAASRYKPKDSQNFLKDWKGGTFAAGWATKPVTWVSLEDARAYAKWAGKRLPHEWEWQYAATGPEKRIYPWGNDWDPAKVPAVLKTGTLCSPAPVEDSSGASPFGVMDLVGNVWQYTDEFSDDHTRAAILKGGSRYQPQGSAWYFPQAYRLDQHGKYLLMAPSKDRSGMVGFRCVKDSS
jgi:formylglycine-generating enzyme required for sulfatase activity